ncbi:MAG TPA: SRPBCC family protein [Candidatus Saccharimonas sp.]|nr:SRPBCC family protein [Candidatus Saccharimonas sp.]
MKITAETTITGDVNIIWDIVTDVKNWPVWDPHEEGARLDGPFAQGTKGWSKPKGGPPADWVITKVIDHNFWASESPMPGGKISGENTFEPLANGQVKLTKTVTVSGPLVPLFWLYFGRMIKRDFFATWAALEREVAKRNK